MERGNLLNAHIKGIQYASGHHRHVQISVHDEEDEGMVDGNLDWLHLGSIVSCKGCKSKIQRKAITSTWGGGGTIEGSRVIYTLPKTLPDTPVEPKQRLTWMCIQSFHQSSAQLRYAWLIGCCDLLSVRIGLDGKHLPLSWLIGWVRMWILMDCCMCLM